MTPSPFPSPPQGERVQERGESVPPSIPVNPTFVDFLCFALDPAFRRLPDSDRQRGSQDFLTELERKRSDVKVRCYLSIGLRHDTDFFLWTAGPDLAPFQHLTADLLRTGFGSFLKLSYTFVAMTRPSVYNPMHLPAFELGELPRKYLFLYPFVKSREWYLLPFEKRREMMRGHMAIGETYPMVRLNTTYSFGLGDQDFVLAFETDEPAAFEDLVQRLRESEVSRYTVRDTPFILGQFCEKGEALIQGLGL
jgi:chlorite dismutase